jgi:hypothetical protein
MHRAERADADAPEGARAAPVPGDRREAPRPGKSLIAIALAAVLVAGGVGAEAPESKAPGGDAPPPRTITLQGDRLTVRVADVPIEEVLQAVAAPSKAEIRGAVQEPRPVTIDFADVPLQDGLGRLLGEQNFVLTYREDGSLKALNLLGAPLEPSAEARIVKDSPTATTQPPAASAADVLQRSVPVSGKLQQFLGQSTATMQQLIDITMRQDDAALRREAVSAGMSAIDSAPDLRATVVRSLRGSGDQVLTSLLGSLPQDRAHEIVTQMATSSRIPEIRARSLQLLRNMSSGAGPETP